MMKRIVCILTAVLVLLSGFAIYAFAENEKLLPEFLPEDSQEVTDEYSIEYSEEQEHEADSFEELAEIAETEIVTEPSTEASVEIPAELPSTRQAPRFVDYADIIPDEDEAEILSLLDSISEEKKFDVVIVTTESTGKRTPMEFADDYFDYGGFGYGENRDGALLLISMEDRDIWVSTRGIGMESIDNVDALIDTFYDEMAMGDYTSACKIFAEKAGYSVDDLAMRAQRFKMRKFILIPIALLIGFIISGVSASGVKNKHKTVVPKVAATSYKVADSLILATKNDNFLYSNVSRMPIVQQVRTPVGGGGAGIHISSSGMSHGGGGRKF